MNCVFLINGNGICSKVYVVDNELFVFVCVFEFKEFIGIGNCFFWVV